VCLRINDWSLYFLGRFNLILDVFRFTCDSSSIDHNDEYLEPVGVEEKHEAEHDARDVSDRLVRNEIRPVREGRETDINHVRKDHQACVAPDEHINDQPERGKEILISLAKILANGSRYVSDVVQEGNHNAHSHTVTERHAEQERNSADVMHQHFKEIVLSLINED